MVAAEAKAQIKAKIFRWFLFMKEYSAIPRIDQYRA
jgi:hypothetical protein